MIDKVEVGKKYRLVDKNNYAKHVYGGYNSRLLCSGVFDSEMCVVIDQISKAIGAGRSKGYTVITPEEYKFFELVEENKTQPKQDGPITPETEVTITTNYGELARAYYVMGKVNGKIHGNSLWTDISNLLGDSDRLIYWENEPNHPMFNYNAVQQKWESLFFKTKEQIAIQQKRKMIAELEKEIKELEEK